jgi:dTDP-4-amino-4,6-dideoxygalactose transaminase
MHVPLLDLTAQYQRIREPLMAAVEGLIESQRFILGPAVDRLEAEVAALLGVEFAIGCASGTDALLLSYRALDAGRDAEIITSPFTFFATAGAIHNSGARPVFADIDPHTFNLDPSAASAAVTERTRAIVPVHLFGQMAPMAKFREVADRHGVALVEDAAQAIAASQRLSESARITTGSLGELCALSFFPTKNLGGFGDGGMIVTNDARLAERLFRLRVHGGRQMYHHQEVGYNSRLDALQAAVLSVKLPFLGEWSAARRRNASYYDQGLLGLEEVITPVIGEGNESIYNQYTIRIAGGKRDALQEELRRQGVGTGVYYPVPLHLQECFRNLGYRDGEFPEAERACREVLSLPIYPELAEEQLAHVVGCIRMFFGV